MFEAPPIASLSSLSHRAATSTYSPKRGALDRDGLRISQITQQAKPVLTEPQLLVFAADHGAATAAAMAAPQAWQTQSTASMVGELISGHAALAHLVAQQGFALTVVDAGLADDLPDHARLVKRKIAHGSRNCCLAPALGEARATAALNAGMELANLLPGNVLALGSLGVGNTISAILLAARLTDIPIERLSANASPSVAAEVLTKANSRHAQSVSPWHALCAFGGYEIAMLSGAMLQAAAERRVVLASGFVAGVALLVAQRMAQHVTDYVLWAAQPHEANEQLIVSHLALHVLPLSSPSIATGSQALMAWPWLQMCAHMFAAVDGTPDEDRTSEQPAKVQDVVDNTSDADEEGPPSTYPTPLQA
jgi:nicotinate-nucleotide--dimethylbenzimidazole phosphoribosyltransferase